MSENIEVLGKFIRDIECQSCKEKLGKIYEDGWSFKPKDIISLCQEIDKDTCLNTLQCPKCDCLIQIKR